MYTSLQHYNAHAYDAIMLTTSFIDVIVSNIMLSQVLSASQ